jgi:4-hydroxy-tetrahydrodipicolinate synthase
MEFLGSMVALVTPFKAGKVDYEAIAHLIEWHIQEGTHALVPCGTTGEAPTLSTREKQELIAFCVQHAAGRIPVIAGTGSNHTDEAVHLTQFAEKVGASGALLVSPYYNKPSPEGLYLHYREIASATRIPLVLYSVPARTGQAIPLEVLFRLEENFDQIVAIKEASNDLHRVNEIVLRCKMKVLSGEDALTLPMLALGATGVISVVANLFPRQMQELVQWMQSGQWTLAQKRHQALYELSQSLFLESNPIPVKYALARLGYIQAEYRLPLCGPQASTQEKLDQVLERCYLRWPPTFYPLNKVS